MKKLKQRKLFLNKYWNDFYIFCNADNLGRVPVNIDTWVDIKKIYDDFISKYNKNLLYTWDYIMKKYPKLSWRDIWKKLEMLNNEVILGI